MKTKTVIAAILLSTLHAPAREPRFSPPATSRDVRLASERQQEDNARIIEQNERLIAAQERASRRAPSPTYYPPIVVSPGPTPPHLITTRPPGYYAALAEKWTREKREREAAMWAKFKTLKP